MNMDRLTTRESWDKHWAEVRLKVLTVKDFDRIIEGLIKRYLPYNKNYDVLEVGCVPGNYLIAFHKVFGYKPCGVDYSEAIDLVAKNMKKNGIKDFKIYRADFLKFNPGRKFNVVFSFGFLEHFTDPLPYVKKMNRLVKKGGYLIIQMPYLRKIQYLIHYLSNKELFKTHNLKYMDINKLMPLIEQLEEYQTLYAGYYGVFHDWPRTGGIISKFLFFLTHGINFINNKLNLNSILANSFTSTEVIFIGKKT